MCLEWKFNPFVLKYYRKLCHNSRGLGQCQGISISFTCKEINSYTALYYIEISAVKKTMLSDHMVRKDQKELPEKNAIYIEITQKPCNGKCVCVSSKELNKPKMVK